MSDETELDWFDCCHDFPVYAAEHIMKLTAERDALREKLERPSWHDYLEITRQFLTFYPPDIFDGSSGDPGPLFVVALRNAVKELDSEEG